MVGTQYPSDIGIELHSDGIHTIQAGQQALVPTLRPGILAADARREDPDRRHLRPGKRLVYRRRPS